MPGTMKEDLVTEIDLETTTLPLTAVDREILSMKDEDYHRHTWEDLKEIIGRSSPGESFHLVSHPCILSKQLPRNIEKTALRSETILRLVRFHQTRIRWHCPFRDSETPLLEACISGRSSTV